MSGNKSDTNEFTVMDSDMVHAMSCMVSAHADLIQSMVVANRNLGAEGEPKDPVFDADRIRNVADSAMGFIPVVRDNTPAAGDGDSEDDSVVLPFRNPNAVED